jgi:hypothetical protein
MSMRRPAAPQATALCARVLLPFLLLIVFVMAGAGPAAAGPRAFVLTNNSLVAIDIANPTQVMTTVPITGVNAGDSVVAIDFRLQNGFLYGLGFNSGAGSVTLYAISYRTGASASSPTRGRTSGSTRTPARSSTATSVAPPDPWPA